LLIVSRHFLKIKAMSKQLARRESSMISTDLSTISLVRVL
jgi:hypothetical protein